MSASVAARVPALRDSDHKTAWRRNHPSDDIPAM
jgi:hypothetical protein